MTNSDLNNYLESIERANRQRVVKTLREGPYETTRIVQNTDESGADVGEPFVVKSIDRSLSEGEAYFALFEAQRKGANLTCVPRLHSVYRTESNVIVEMELLDGKTLEEDFAHCSGRLKRTREVFGRVLEAVAQLHLIEPNPVIHRDLKPLNIMICNGEVKLVDFGAARVYKPESSQDTTHFGTRGYAPPEQFGFGQTTPRSDIYALGMVLVYCLTGEAPDSAEAHTDEARARAPELWRVVDKATELDPDNRYASAWDMYLAFSRACGPIAVDQGSPKAAPRTQTQSQAQAQSQPRAATKGSGLSGIEIAGLVWDVFLLIAWAGFFIVGLVTMLLSDQFSDSPLWFQIAFVVIVFGIMIGSIAFLISSKRPLYHAFPWLKKFTLPRQIITVVIVFVVCFFLTRGLARLAGHTVTPLF